MLSVLEFIILSFKWNLYYHEMLLLLCAFICCMQSTIISGQMKLMSCCVTNEEHALCFCRNQQSEIQQLTLKLQNLTQQDEQMIARSAHHLMTSLICWWTVCISLFLITIDYKNDTCLEDFPMLAVIVLMISISMKEIVIFVLWLSVHLLTSIGPSCLCQLLLL